MHCHITQSELEGRITLASEKDVIVGRVYVLPNLSSDLAQTLMFKLPSEQLPQHMINDEGELRLIHPLIQPPAAGAMLLVGHMTHTGLGEAVRAPGYLHATTAFERKRDRWVFQMNKFAPVLHRMEYMHRANVISSPAVGVHVQVSGG